MGKILESPISTEIKEESKIGDIQNLIDIKIAN